MPLRLANLNAVLSWQLSMPIPGYQPRKQGLDSHSANLFGLSLAKWDELYTEIIDLSEGESATIDLTTLENLVGEVFGFTKVLALFITATGSSARIEPGASDGIDWIGGASDGVDLIPGESFVKVCAASSDGYPVSSSHKNLKISNIGVATGTEGLSVKVTILGSTQS